MITFYKINLKQTYMEKANDLVVKLSLLSNVIKCFMVICASKVLLNVFVFKCVKFTKGTCES